MEGSAKKSTRVSNLEKMSPEGKAKAKFFLSDEFGQMLVDNLNRNVLLEESKRRSLTDEEQKKLDALLAKVQEKE